MAKTLGFRVYLQKIKEHHFLGLKIKKSNKKMARTLVFWVYLKKEEHHICMPPTKEKFWNKILPSFLSTSTKNEEPLFLGNRSQKNDKILEK